MYLLNLMNLDQFSWTQCLKRHDFSWFQRKCNLCNFGMIFITSIFHVHVIMISINTLLDHWLMLWVGLFFCILIDRTQNKEAWIDHVSVENFSTRKHFFLNLLLPKWRKYHGRSHKLPIGVRLQDQIVFVRHVFTTRL